MKLTLQHVFDATPVIANIIREGRPVPQKGAYRLARLHAKLYPEYTLISERRDKMITAYGYHPRMPKPGAPDPAILSDDYVESEVFAVPADKMEEFTAAWAEVAAEEIDVEVQPVPLSQLDLGDSVPGSISANELITLGDLVTE